MRVKEGFVLRDVAGQTVVIATGKASKNFHGMIRLNATGKDIWQGLQEGLSDIEISENLSKKYEIDLEDAENDVKEFLGKIREMGFLENE